MHKQELKSYFQLRTQRKKLPHLTNISSQHDSTSIDESFVDAQESLDDVTQGHVKNPETWNNQDIQEWLRSNQFGHLAHLFQGRRLGLLNSRCGGWS